MIWTRAVRRCRCTSARVCLGSDERWRPHRPSVDTRHVSGHREVIHVWKTIAFVSRQRGVACLRKGGRHWADLTPSGRRRAVGQHFSFEGLASGLVESRTEFLDLVLEKHDLGEADQFAVDPDR